MVILPLGLDAPDGLVAYPEPQVVADEGGERGEAISGRRMETVTYVAREAGSYSLPPVELARWDVEAGALRRETVPAVVFQVLPGEASVEFALGSGDDEEAGAAGQGDGSEQVSLTALLRRWAVPLAVVLIVGLVLRRAARAAGFSLGHLTARWQAREQSEGAHFRRFRRARPSRHGAHAGGLARPASPRTRRGDFQGVRGERRRSGAGSGSGQAGLRPVRCEPDRRLLVGHPVRRAGWQVATTPSRRPPRPCQPHRPAEPTLVAGVPVK